MEKTSLKRGDPYCEQTFELDLENRDRVLTYLSVEP